MTIIVGKEEITVVDPFVSEETAKVAIDLYYADRGRKPVKAVIYTHSHVGHYGGVCGVISQDGVQSGKVKIYAPEIPDLPQSFARVVSAPNAFTGAVPVLDVP